MAPSRSSPVDARVRDALRLVSHHHSCFYPFPRISGCILGFPLFAGRRALLLSFLHTLHCTASSLARHGRLSSSAQVDIVLHDAGAEASGNAVVSAVESAVTAVLSLRVPESGVRIAGSGIDNASVPCVTEGLGGASAIRSLDRIHTDSACS